MPIAAQAARVGCKLQLEWTPREANVEADALSNGDASGFDPDKRIAVAMNSGSCLVMPEFMEEGRKYEKELRLLRAKGPRQEGKDIKKPRHETSRVRDPWPT